MRPAHTAAAAEPPGSGGFVHAALLYADDDQFVTSAVSFLEDAARGGGPVIVALGPASSRLLRAAAPDTLSAAGALDLGGHHHRPAAVLRHYHELFTRLVADGATRVSVLGEVPHPGIGVPWDEWARYEAAINHAYAPFPVRGLCSYDLRTTPPEVLDDVRRTHPLLHGAQGSVHSPGFEGPEAFLARHAPPPREWALPARTAAVDLTDPSPWSARAAVQALARDTALVPEDVDNLVLAVSEAVSNGLVHGEPPVRLRMWPEADRVVAAVDDRGRGPAGPYAGMLRVTDSATGGLGLWLIHQVCAQVSFGRVDGGFRIRMVAGLPDGVDGGS